MISCGKRSKRSKWCVDVHHYHETPDEAKENLASLFLRPKRDLNDLRIECSHVVKRLYRLKWILSSTDFMPGFNSVAVVEHTIT